MELLQMTDLNELDYANRVADRVFLEVCEFMDRAVAEVVNHLPPLEERQPRWGKAIQIS